MKKVLLVLVLAALVAGGAFAQQRQPAARSSAAKNAITMDVIPLVKGMLASNSDADLSFFCMSFAYERLVAPSWSVGAELDLYPGKAGEEPGGDNIPFLYLGMAVAGRYYLMSQNMEKGFIGASLGFNRQSIDGKTDGVGFMGPTIGLRIGYRLLLGKMFVIEPSMAYIYAKYNGAPTPLGWQGGLRLGVSF